MIRHMRRKWATLLIAGLIGQSLVPVLAADDKHKDKEDKDAAAEFKTETPIKHVIILIGENRGLDHTFGVYKPKGKNQTISNVLSKGIVNEDGTPGPNYSLAQQYAVSAQPFWYVGAPNSAKAAYNTTTNLMPQPNTNGAPTAALATFSGTGPFVSIPAEPDIEAFNAFELTTGATGLPTGVLDTRIPGAGHLPPGPFVLQGPNISDDDYTGDMTHRFYQAWQQQDCSLANATKANPTGCLNDLFAFVMATYSASNKSAGNEMGFYNAEQEQASFLKTLADRFTLSDNFHQSVLGGTGANHFMFGTGDAGFWSDGNGNPVKPPSNIANPNPKVSTVNQYTADNNFSNCSDATQPGIGPIVSYINALPYAAEPNCDENHYYMLNNTNPGYLPDGTPAPAVQGALPPSSVPTIGDNLNGKNISWAYFGGSYNDAAILAAEAVLANPANPNLTAAALADPVHAIGATYCQICNPFQYAKSIMGDATQRAAHIKDTSDLITDIENNTLPAVSIGKPDGLLDGHPQSSKIDLFEAYVQNILDALDAHPALKKTTAVFITWDEAGGYWDSGFVQVFDFFGDGPRIPLLVLSPYSTGGKVTHGYADHV
ncbi:MAG TPA: alkaline phosphatase family protein, partial [Vicinamibacterales bacterium]|nr:alkaline phosphatase family protein [Vicinamibacterales bacterium]